MKKFLMSFFILAGVNTSTVAQVTCTPANEEFRIVTGNGVFTTLEGAADNRNALMDALGPTFNSQKIRYDLAMNYSKIAVDDLFEVTAQAGAELDNALMRLLNNSGVIPDSWREHQALVLTRSYPVSSTELIAHVQKYQEFILQGQKTLVVAHSQGNFYVNQAKELLAAKQPAVPMESFGIIGVATPSNNVGGISGPDADRLYVTNHRDGVTKGPLALRSNLQLTRLVDGAEDNVIGPFDAHSFSGTYLSPKYNARAVILDKIKNQLSLLKDPPVVIKSGPITVTLTWPLANSDIDLHVFEPDGTHVYYESKVGVSGTLDVDNTVSFGPEHYFTDCNQLQVGEYRIGVNYFDDHDNNNQGDTRAARPLVAAVTVSVPNSTRALNIPLSVEFHSAGNATPKLVVKIIVERIVDPGNPNINGTLKYTIVPL